MSDRIQRFNKAWCKPRQRNAPWQTQLQCFIYLDGQWFTISWDAADLHVKRTWYYVWMRRRTSSSAPAHAMLQFYVGETNSVYRRTQEHIRNARKHLESAQEHNFEGEIALTSPDEWMLFAIPALEVDERTLIECLLEAIDAARLAPQQLNETAGTCRKADRSVAEALVPSIVAVSLAIPSSGLPPPLPPPAAGGACFTSKNGKKYHRSQKCAGEGGKAMTVDEALKMELEECKKCRKRPPPPPPPTWTPGPPPPPPPPPAPGIACSVTQSGVAEAHVRPPKSMSKPKSPTLQPYVCVAGNRKIYHKPECSTLNRAREEDRLEPVSLDEAQTGMKPCKRCKPDAEAPSASDSDADVLVKPTPQKVPQHPYVCVAGNRGCRGKKYHMPECHTLARSKNVEPVSLDEAQAGMEPCKRCKPSMTTAKTH